MIALHSEIIVRLKLLIARVLIAAGLATDNRARLALEGLAGHFFPFGFLLLGQNTQELFVCSLTVFRYNLVPLTLSLLARFLVKLAALSSRKTIVQRRKSFTSNAVAISSNRFHLFFLFISEFELLGHIFIRKRVPTSHLQGDLNETIGLSGIEDLGDELLRVFSVLFYLC